VNEAPWLSPEKVRLIKCLLISHQKAFNRSLIKHKQNKDSRRLQSQELFITSMPVIAHDHKKDPSIIYANSAALQLWGRHWDEIVGMPSKLTAPTNQHMERSAALDDALTKDCIQNYRGTRVNKKGELFTIQNARIWTIWDEHGLVIGQGATFSTWWHL